MRNRKRYYTVYLPVEGKMEIGDKIRTMTGYIKEYEGRYTDLEHPHKIGLFLCDHYVNIGDKIFNLHDRRDDKDAEEYTVTSIEPDDVIDYPWYANYHYTNEYYISTPDVLKIVDQIPEEQAKWMTADMQFDDEDFQCYSLRSGKSAKYLEVGDRVTIKSEDGKPVLFEKEAIISKIFPIEEGVWDWDDVMLLTNVVQPKFKSDAEDLNDVEYIPLLDMEEMRRNLAHKGDLVNEYKFKCPTCKHLH